MAEFVGAGMITARMWALLLDLAPRASRPSVKLTRDGLHVDHITPELPEVAT